MKKNNKQSNMNKKNNMNKTNSNISSSKAESNNSKTDIDCK